MELDERTGGVQASGEERLVGQISFEDLISEMRF